MLHGDGLSDCLFVATICSSKTGLLNTSPETAVDYTSAKTSLIPTPGLREAGSIAIHAHSSYSALKVMLLQHRCACASTYSWSVFLQANAQAALLVALFRKETRQGLMHWTMWALPSQIPGIPLQQPPAQLLDAFITDKIKQFQDGVDRRAAVRPTDHRCEQAQFAETPALVQSGA